jgi:toxin-antitoxin system PIN domain toxin
LSKIKYLADVNVLIALLDEDHIHHKLVLKWFNATGSDEFGVCAFTEAGFLRVATNPKAGLHTIDTALDALTSLNNYSGYRFWPISKGWVSLAAPFIERVFGHQQITDAYLLGLAIKEKGVLVTMDKAIRFLAGDEYRRNVLVLE